MERNALRPYIGRVFLITLVSARSVLARAQSVLPATSFAARSYLPDYSNSQELVEQRTGTPAHCCALRQDRSSVTGPAAFVPGGNATTCDPGSAPPCREYVSLYWRVLVAQPLFRVPGP